MNHVSAHALLLLPICLFACGTPSESKGTTKNTDKEATVAVPIDPNHNSQNSLDWPGTYSGTPPRPEGDGFVTTLRLYDTQQFTQTIERPGEVGSVVSTGGYFDWRPDGATIQLNGYNPETTPTFFLIGENQLFMLPLDGARTEDDLTDADRMPRVTTPLMGTSWQLQTIRGDDSRLGKIKSPTLLLSKEGSTATGMGGCNQFRGTFTEDQNRLSFSPLMSTKMACPELTIEASYQTALSQVSRYRQLPGILILESEESVELLRFSAR